MRALAICTPALVLLAACSSGEDAAPPPAAEGGERIACAVGGAVELTESCAVDRVQADGRLDLIVRHPDGAFRRFSVVTDGRGLVVADGAEQAETRLEGDKLSVRVAEDRYLFPATSKSAAPDARP